MNPENQKLLAEISNGAQAFDLPRSRTEWVSADRFRTQKQPTAVSIVPEIRRSAFCAADIETEDSNDDLVHPLFVPEEDVHKTSSEPEDVWLIRT